MIIIDLNQVMISNLMAQIGAHTNIEVEEGLLRHMVLNSIRSNISKFKEYGEVVIACDDKNYWRRDVFPYYKASRKEQRAKSELDWNSIFNSLNKIRDELKENFPYKVIQVERAEADDIIGCLVRKFGWNSEQNPVRTADIEDILILSGDKDFQQLQKFENVQQFNPVTKKWIRAGDPHKYLIEHAIKGDRTDGIPNAASPDDVFVSGGRQKPIRQKLIDQVIKSGELPNDLHRGYARNLGLIDLTNTPENIMHEVFSQYREQGSKDRSKLFNYFVKNQLKGLMEHINEF